MFNTRLTNAIAIPKRRCKGKYHGFSHTMWGLTKAIAMPKRRCKCPLLLQWLFAIANARLPGIPEAARLKLFEKTVGRFVWSENIHTY